MTGNSKLHAARRNKKDEFYTQREDIENELWHYREHFAGKTVFCNCDNRFESEFTRYFALKFNALGLKRLITVGYAGSPLAGQQLSLDGIDRLPQGSDAKAHVIDMRELKDWTEDGRESIQDVRWLLHNHPKTLRLIDGDGDFRSPESIELLGQADIVVTNPPFSLFNEYLAQLIEYDKKFLIVGHQNAATHKDIFPLIKNEQMWLGHGFRGGAAHFFSPYEDYAKAGDHKEGMVRVSGVVWFTNLDHQKRHEPLLLYKRYNPEEYPHYDNYDAINVDEVKYIPEDWEGAIGVPISYLNKHNPEQFEIVESTAPGSLPLYVNGKKKFGRIIIQRKV